MQSTPKPRGAEPTQASTAMPEPRGQALSMPGSEPPDAALHAPLSVPSAAPIAWVPPDLAAPDRSLVPLFPLSPDGTGLVLFDGEFNLLRVHWSLRRADAERAAASFPALGGPTRTVVRLRRELEQGGSELIREHALDGGGRACCGDTSFPVAADHGRYRAELGLANHQGGWLMLARSNGLYHAAGIGLRLAGPMADPVQASAPAVPTAPGAAVDQSVDGASVPGVRHPDLARAPAGGEGSGSIQARSIAATVAADPALFAKTADSVGAFPLALGFPVEGAWAGLGTQGLAPVVLAADRLAQSGSLPLAVGDAAVVWLPPQVSPLMAPVQVWLQALGATAADPGARACDVPAAMDVAMGTDIPGPGEALTQTGSRAGSTQDGGGQGTPVFAPLEPLRYQTQPRRDGALEIEAELRISGRAAPGATIDLFGNPYQVGPGGRFQLVLALTDPELIRRALAAAPPAELVRRRDP